MPSRSPLRSPALLAALLALTACAGPRAEREARPALALDQGPRAFLWEVTRPDAPDRPLYLTGSIHVGRPGQFVFPPSMERAIARSDVLVVEADPRKTDMAGLQRLALELGMYRPPETLSSRLDEETRALLAAALERNGLVPQAVESVRPWMLAATLAVIELQRAGYDPKAGVDQLLLARFAAPKEVVELESAEGQLRMLAALPERVQVLMLRDAAAAGPGTALALAQLAAAWEGGNADGLASVAFERADDPELAPMYEAVFHARNRAMAERLAPLAGAEKVHLAVVGAGPVVGEEGLVALLAARGLRVRQLARE